MARKHAQSLHHKFLRLMEPFIVVRRELRPIVGVLQRLRSSEDTIVQAPMSMREAAETLDGGRTRIYELIAAGWLQTFVIGGRRYVTRDSFERMIEAAQDGVDVLAAKTTSAALSMSKVARRRT